MSRTEPKQSESVSASEEESPIKERQITRSSVTAIESLRVPSFSDIAEEERNIRLGLGDFIFYSILVGNAAVLADLTTIVACFVSILVGLGFTLILLIIVQKALPALPISVAFGAIAFFSSNFVTSKLLDLLNEEQIFL
ncbi:hypothetical protein ANCCAN_05039 [Ancylostoma caninum]|uniref:Presenilin n=1 Tax=Ancylostoma caninum TaxID=29170 RepID=A0A368H108_ANCCA|nr:hypothetical protein ANCCAN_05039 [Ancylostoma caninum]